MNKFTLSYILIVNASVIALAIANMISGNFFLRDILYIIISSISIYCVFNLTKKYVYHFLCITNFIQSYSLILFGFSYKFLLGPDLSFYFYREGDLFTKFEFNIFNGASLYSKDLNSNNWSIGINFIHLYIVCYSYSLIYKSKTKISNVA